MSPEARVIPAREYVYVYPPAEHLFGRRESRLRPVHIVAAEPWKHEALCGVHVFTNDIGAVIDDNDAAQFCRKCLKAAGVQAAALERGPRP